MPHLCLSPVFTLFIQTNSFEKIGSSLYSSCESRFPTTDHSLLLNGVKYDWESEVMNERELHKESADNGKQIRTGLLTRGGVITSWQNVRVESDCPFVCQVGTRVAKLYALGSITC